MEETKYCSWMVSKTNLPPPGVSSLRPTAPRDWMAGPKLLFFQLLCGLWGRNIISIGLDWQPPPQHHYHASGQYCRIPSGKLVLSFRNHTQKCHTVNDRPPFPSPSFSHPQPHSFEFQEGVCAYFNLNSSLLSALMCSCLVVFLWRAMHCLGEREQTVNQNRVFREKRAPLLQTQ